MNKLGSQKKRSICGKLLSQPVSAVQQPEVGSSVLDAAVLNRQCWLCICSCISCSMVQLKRKGFTVCCSVSVSADTVVCREQLMML